MKKNKLILFILVFVLVISLIVLNKNQNRLSKDEKARILAETDKLSNTIGAYDEPEIKYSDIVDVAFDPKNMPYQYDIKNGKMIVDGQEYTIKIAEDGVLLIFEGYYEEGAMPIASAKKPVPETTDKKDNVAHYAHIGFAEYNARADYINSNSEEQRYEIYANAENYTGTDVTPYDATLYNKYINDKVSG